MSEFVGPIFIPLRENMGHYEGQASIAISGAYDVLGYGSKNSQAREDAQNHRAENACRSQCGKTLVS